MESAQDLLTALILAAAVGRLTLRDVYGWVADSRDERAARILDEAGFPAAAGSLRARINGAAETRDGVYMTAAAAVRCLRSEEIMDWVCPRPGDPWSPGEAGGREVFDPAEFVTSSDTLYLLSKDGAGSAAPLVASFVDRLFREATTAAERQGGRLSTPLYAVLDEAANVVKISDLPELYSHLGSRGIHAITILQSPDQGMRVWGADGFKAMWGAATIKLIGPGMDNEEWASQVARLVGQDEVSTVSTSYSRSGTSTSHGDRQDWMLPANLLRAMPKGTALLFATGLEPVILHLHPWYDSANAKSLAAGEQHCKALVREARERTAGQHT